MGRLICKVIMGRYLVNRRQREDSCWSNWSLVGSERSPACLECNSSFNFSPSIYIFLILHKIPPIPPIIQGREKLEFKPVQLISINATTGSPFILLPILMQELAGKVARVPLPQLVQVQEFSPVQAGRVLPPMVCYLKHNSEKLQVSYIQHLCGDA